MREEPELWRQYREHPETFRFPSGESLEAQQRRVLACLRDCALDGRAALLVAHGGSIRLTRCFLEGHGIDAYHTTKTTNGGVDEIDTEGLARRIDAHLGAGLSGREPKAHGPDRACRCRTRGEPPSRPGRPCGILRPRADCSHFSLLTEAMTPPDDPTPTLPDDSAQTPFPGEPGYPTGSAEAPAIETAAPAPGKLKQRVIPDPPEMDQARAGGRSSSSSSWCW